MTSSGAATGPELLPYPPGMIDPSIIPGLILQLQRLQDVAQAADQALTRLTHPIIDPEAVPPEVVAVIVRELSDALSRLEEGGTGGDARGGVQEVKRPRLLVRWWRWTWTWV